MNLSSAIISKDKLYGTALFYFSIILSRLKAWILKLVIADLLCNQ